MPKRKAGKDTAIASETKRTRGRKQRTIPRGIPECNCLRLLSALSKPKHDESVLCMEELKEGSANGCQYCAIVLEAARIFMSGRGQSKLQTIRISNEDNGLLQLFLSGFDSDGEYGQVGVCEVFTLPGVQTAWPMVPIGHVRQTYTGSRIYLDYILPWARKCAMEHPICRRQENRFIPKRVLDLGQSDEGQVRLLKTQAIHASEDYICLSHMWGTFKPLQTTMKSLSDRISCIPLTKLPPTFRDAVKITRYLGVRYLWIDSLCIVQDDHDDWVMQSAQMASIYGNSFLTIFAAVSGDASDGIFKQASHSAWHIEIPDQVNLKRSTGLFVRDAIYHQHLRPFEQYAYEDHCKEWYSRTPLMGRAWVYQEYLLSPRVVFFSRDEVVWQCNEKSWCCCSPHPIKSGLKISLARVLDAGTTGKPTEGLSMLTCWERIVRYFSLKSITKEEDRLPALSGIVRRFQSVRNGRYLAGLWEDNLIKDLCWKVSFQGRRPKTYVAPSWSWCSIFESSSRTSDSDLARVYVHVREVSCTPSTSDPTGAVSSGFVRISGLLLQGKGVITSNATRPIFRFRDMEFAFYADALGDDLPAIQSSKCTLYGLKIGIECQNPHREAPALYVLILVELKGSPDRFQRIGIAEIDESSWWDECGTRRTITVI